MAVAIPVAGAAALLAIDIAETVLIQIVGQLVAATVGAALAPEFSALQGASFSLTPGQRLTPDQAAVATVKGHLAAATAVEEARFYGINADRFKVLTAAAGNPPPADFLLQLARRGIIPIADAKGADSTSAEQGIRESFLHDKWISILEQGQWLLPGLGALIEARLRNFITPDQYNRWTHQLGYKDDAAGLEFLAAGVPLSLQEGYTAYHRGLIPLDSPDPNVPSLKQIFRESRVIDKYVEVWTQLNEYRPPPRTVTALHRAGALTDEQALDAYKQEGLNDYWAAIYVKTAHHERAQTTKELTKAEWLAMYQDQAISAEELRTRLASLGFTGEGGDLEVQLADLKVAHALEQRAVNRVGTLYIGRRIDKAQAMNTLDSLKLPTKQRDRLLEVWTLERADNLKHLTATVLAWAVKEGIMQGGAAVEELTRQGYGPRDAWLELSYHLKAPVTPAMPSDNLPPA